MELQQKIDLEEKLANRDEVSVAMELTVAFVNIFTAISGNLLVQLQCSVLLTRTFCSLRIDVVRYELGTYLIFEAFQVLFSNSCIEFV